MVEDIVKEAVKSAEQEMKNEEKDRIKGIVRATLELLQKKKVARKIIDEEIRILEKDILDLKEGHIDRIKERQDCDPKARDISVIIVKEKIIEKQVATPMWYWPWIIEIKPQYILYIPVYTGTQITYCNSTITSSTNNVLVTDATSIQSTFTTNNSSAHMYTSGSYVLEDGTIKHL